MLIETDGGKEVARQDIALRADDPQARAIQLFDAGAGVLICGAISRPLEFAIAAMGIEVRTQICGNVECVLSAFIDGSLDQAAFLMPGCCARRRQMGGGQRRGRRWNAS